MKAVDPNDPTMLIMTCIGVGIGIGGSSNTRSLPEFVDAVLGEIRPEGEDGKWPPLQPRVTTQAISSDGNASFMRMSRSASKVNARRKL
jgi:hypothetical protein